MPEIIAAFRVIIVIGAVVAVTETVASALWLPVYFRYGIRLYSRQLPVRLPGTAPDLMDIVSCSTTGLCFHRLSSQDVAFREPLITFTRVPLMHGRMICDDSKVQMVGFVNWTIVVVGILFFALGIMFLLHAPIYAIFPLVIFRGAIGVVL
jgi:hypothetical protein